MIELWDLLRLKHQSARACRKLIPRLLGTTATWRRDGATFEQVSEGVNGYTTGNVDDTGAQHPSLDHLRQWESLKFGMFIHFGTSTFDGQELSKGDLPAAVYAPDELDVGQ